MSSFHICVIGILLGCYALLVFISVDLKKICKILRCRNRRDDNG